jgi:hypothetical protein
VVVILVQVAFAADGREASRVAERSKRVLAMTIHPICLDDLVI